MHLQRSFRMDMMALERLWWRFGGKFQSIQVLVDLQRGSSRKLAGNIYRWSKREGMAVLLALT